jgi:hypothetical protein
MDLQLISSKPLGLAAGARPGPRPDAKNIRLFLSR